MAEEIIPDPDHVPVVHVTGLVSRIANGQTIMMNFVTDRMAVTTDGKVQPDLVIGARLRFDLDVARRIRDQLDVHLSGLTAANLDETKPN